MILVIKNMVCNRCIMVVKQQLDDQEIEYDYVHLGEVLLTKTPTTMQLERLRQNLLSLGFEILDDKKASTVSKIKNLIIKLIRQKDYDEINKKLSSILSEEIKMDYSYISNLFSSIEGVTIERYAILQKIEYVKELLKYDELNLNEIAFKLGYSSAQHLSLQFKKVTGLTPTQFKNLQENIRQPLDEL